MAGRGLTGTVKLLAELARAFAEPDRHAQLTARESAVLERWGKATSLVRSFIGASRSQRITLLL